MLIERYKMRYLKQETMKIKKIKKYRKKNKKQIFLLGEKRFLKFKNKLHIKIKK